MSLFSSTRSRAAAFAVLAFDRAADGHLIGAGSFATGGRGSGTSLGSQGPVAVRGDTVYAVDAGSGDIAALRATRHGLRPFDRESAGAQPISVTVHGSLLWHVADSRPATHAAVEHRALALALDNALRRLAPELRRETLTLMDKAY